MDNGFWPSFSCSAENSCSAEKQLTALPEVGRLARVSVACSLPELGAQARSSS
jgi:hypothetical protein